MKLAKRVRPYYLPLIVSLLLGAVCASRIIERAGEPALPLDDSFIHLQFAKQLAEGSWFSYVSGEGYSSGATSMLWPLAIAPFFVLGLGELDIIYVVWLLGCVLHAAVALEAYRLSDKLAGRAAAIAAAVLCFLFGAHAWFAYSGMETIALTWILARGARVASEVCEGENKHPQLVALGLLAPLVRPEGIVVSAMALIVALRSSLGALPIESGTSRRRPKAWWFLPLAGPLIVPAMHSALAGHATSSTATVKWLGLDPYLDRSEFIAATAANVGQMVTDLLNGGPYTWLFLPEGFVFALGGGVIAMTALAIKRRAGWRAFMVLFVIASTFGVTTYATMLWNRVRYIWPFGWSWLVAAVCLPAAIGEALARIRPKMRMASPILLWGGIAYFSMDLDGAIDDLATSARAIAKQQVALGKWARRALHEDAVIGVNDTGAIAYMSHRRTFDVVGLTTEGQARHWAEGAGSRFEHYERMERSDLPTHFIVYPGWMRMDAVLGGRLAEATVIDQSILGGKTMVAYAARYDLLGSGGRIAGVLKGDVPIGDVLDVLDVADVISEREHRFERGRDARSHYNVATVGFFGASTIADGGRLQRGEDRFTLAASDEARLIMRVRCSSPLEVYVYGERIGEPEVLDENSTWDVRAITLPASPIVRKVTVRPTAHVRFDSWHYWLVNRR